MGFQGEEGQFVISQNEIMLKFSIIFDYHVCFLVAIKMYSENSEVNNQSYLDERPTNTHQSVQQNEGKQAAKKN